MEYKKAGVITHYFDKIGVAVMQVTDLPIVIGDEIRIGEEDCGLEQKAESMQIDHVPILEAKVGDEVGLKVNDEIKCGNVVYKAL